MNARPTIQCSVSIMFGKKSRRHSRDEMDESADGSCESFGASTIVSTGVAHTLIHRPQSVGKTTTSQASSAHILIVVSSEKSARSSEGTARMPTA